MESIIYEASFNRRSFDEIFREYNPDAVAVTGYITQENIMLSYVRRAKELCPGCITMVGGSHAQLNPERFFDRSFFPRLMEPDNTVLFPNAFDRISALSELGANPPNKTS